MAKKVEQPLYSIALCKVVRHPLTGAATGADMHGGAGTIPGAPGAAGTDTVRTFRLVSSSSAAKGKARGGD
ncbi:MAG: hypothetical protein ACP5R4_09460 [Armatimonadota bacterium]